jgi:hypothetical protein
MNVSHEIARRSSYAFVSLVVKALNPQSMFVPWGCPILFASFAKGWGHAVKPT